MKSNNLLSRRDETFLRQAIETANRARKNGNHPFGALLVDEHDSIIAVGENTVIIESDATCHAETKVIRTASRAGCADRLKACTLYTRTEPCLMCCGAIHWAAIPRVVYGCAAETLSDLVGSREFLFPCRQIFDKATNPRVEIVGPVLESEAVEVHHGYWGK